MWATHGPNAPKRRYPGTISAKLLMQLDENLPPERLNTPPLDAIRVQREAQALYTPGRIITSPGCEDNHGPNAPKRRYLGTISSKLLMYLDENLPSERLNAPHLDASASKEEHKYYIRQVELLHCQVISVGRVR